MVGCHACSPLHAGSWWRARQEMAKLIANYDSSTAGDALLRALVACGASDVAHSLSQSRSASQVCYRLLHLLISSFWAGACSLVEEGPSLCGQQNSLVKCVSVRAGVLSSEGCFGSAGGQVGRTGVESPHGAQRLLLLSWVNPSSRAVTRRFSMQ